MANHFVIHCLDAPDAGARRLQHYGAHKAYLESAPLRILVSGPLLADDLTTMIGSFFLVEAADRAAVEAFNAADPFNLNRIWQQIAIHPFLKRVDTR